MLVHNNFMYHHKKVLRNGEHAWRCTEYYNIDLKCSATICTTGKSNNSHVTNEDMDHHNHPANETKIQKKKIENKIKNAAVNKEQTSSRIVNEVVQNTTDEVKEALPSMEAMCKMVRRKRQNL